GCANSLSRKALKARPVCGQTAGWPWYESCLMRDTRFRRLAGAVSFVARKAGKLEALAFHGGWAKMSNSQLQSVARLCRKRAQRLWYYGVASLLGLAVTAGATPQGTPPAQQAPAVAAPLDEPLRLIDNARRSMEGIRDYTCLL